MTTVLGTAGASISNDGCLLSAAVGFSHAHSSRKLLFPLPAVASVRLETIFLACLHSIKSRKPQSHLFGTRFLTHAATGFMSRGTDETERRREQSNGNDLEFVGDAMDLGAAGMEDKEHKAISGFNFSQVPDHLLPKVAIVGRPNVGKSALFNRLAGDDVAIVNDEPGVTRDRLYARGYWGLHEFMLVDTGGVVNVPKLGSTGIDGIAITGKGGQNVMLQAVHEAKVAGLPFMIEQQAALALNDASVIIFVVDGKAGVSSVDVDISDWLRRKHAGKKIILAVNKCESPTKGLLQSTEFWSLGFEPIAVSAISGRGTGDLLDLVCSGLVSQQSEEGLLEEETRIPAIAIVGKPNVGKSTILNALAGEKRAIVRPVNGTTRDTIDTEVTGPVWIHQPD